MNLKDKLADMQAKKLVYINIKEGLYPIELTCFADVSNENAIQAQLVQHVDRFTELLYGGVPPLYYIETSSREERAAIGVKSLIPQGLKWVMNSIPLPEIQEIVNGFGFEASIIEVARNVPEAFFKVDMWPEPPLNDKEIRGIIKEQTELFWAEHPVVSKTFKALKVEFNLAITNTEI